MFGKKTVLVCVVLFVVLVCCLPLVSGQSLKPYDKPTYTLAFGLGHAHASDGGDISLSSAVYTAWQSPSTCYVWGGSMNISRQTGTTGSFHIAIYTVNLGTTEPDTLIQSSPVYNMDGNIPTENGVCNTSFAFTFPTNPHLDSGTWYALAVVVDSINEGGGRALNVMRIPNQGWSGYYYGSQWVFSGTQVFGSVQCVLNGDEDEYVPVTPTPFPAPTLDGVTGVPSPVSSTIVVPSSAMPIGYLLILVLGACIAGLVGLYKYFENAENRAVAVFVSIIGLIVFLVMFAGFFTGAIAQSYTYTDSVGVEHTVNSDVTEVVVSHAQNLVPMTSGWTTATTGMAFGIGGSANVVADSSELWYGNNTVRIDEAGVTGNNAREADSAAFNVSVGDRIVFTCWMKTSDSSVADTVGGARIGIDIYGAAGAITGTSSPNGAAVYTDSGWCATDTYVHWGTSTWTKMVIDFTVASSYEHYDCAVNNDVYAEGEHVVPTAIIAWLQVQGSADTGDGWFADTSLFVNP